jgi:signal transduction histidine kinase
MSSPGRALTVRIAAALALAAVLPAAAVGALAIYRARDQVDPSRLDAPAAQLAADLSHAATRDTLLAVLVGGAVALALGVALAARLTRPLRALAARADAIAADVELAPRDRQPVGGPGEIGELAVRLERMARHLAARMRHKNALARGDRAATAAALSARLARELGGPLAEVVGHAELLLAAKPEGGPESAGLRSIVGAARHAQRVVAELIDDARARATPIDDAPAEPADVNDLARRTEVLIAPTAHHKRITVALELAEPLPRAGIDARDLAQACLDVALRAVQAMSNGGTLTIATELGPGASALRVRFAATECRMAPADAERVFEPPDAPRGAAPGARRGLAVARHLICRAGGSLTYEPGDDRLGAAFQLVVPISG